MMTNLLETHIMYYINIALHVMLLGSYTDYSATLDALVIAMISALFFSSGRHLVSNSLTELPENFFLANTELTLL